MIPVDWVERKDNKIKHKIAVHDTFETENNEKLVNPTLSINFWTDTRILL